MSNYFLYRKEKVLKSFLLLFSFLFIFSLISAVTICDPSLQNGDLTGLPAQKQDSNVLVIQSSQNSTYCNISSIIVGSNSLLGETNMPEISDNYYSYSFNMTATIGTYIVNGHCDENGVDIPWAYSFIVNPTGQSDNPNFFYIILIFSFGVIILGITVFRNGWITILGSFGLVCVGLYIIRFGINGIRDTVYTWGWGIIILAVAGYIGIKSAYEMIQDS